MELIEAWRSATNNALDMAKGRFCGRLREPCQRGHEHSSRGGMMEEYEMADMRDSVDPDGVAVSIASWKSTTLQRSVCNC